MTVPAPQVSVAIVNWNTRDKLLACLASLSAGQVGRSCEIIVVDNGSIDGSADAVASRFPEVQLIRNTASRGFAVGTNQALARARAPLWALSGPDTVFTPGALAILCAELDHEPEAWAVGPQLLNSDGSLQPSGRRFPGLGRTWLEGILPEACKRWTWWVRRVFGRTDFSRPAWVDEVSGACFVARREAFTRAGQLDERFFIYFEEVDWFRRVARVGGKTRYQPRARVYHHWGAAMAQMAGEGLMIHFRSAFAYWRKWRGWPGEACMRAIAFSHAGAWLAVQWLRLLIRKRTWSETIARTKTCVNVMLLALGLRT